MSEYIGCPLCASFQNYYDTEAAEEKAEQHNETRHDGDEIARVIQPDSKESVNDFVDTAREEGTPEQLEKTIRKITRGNSPFTVATIGDL